MFFPHVQSYNEQNPEIIHDSDTSEMIQIDQYNSYDDSEIDDNVFDDDAFWNNDDDQSILFDKETYKS